MGKVIQIYDNDWMDVTDGTITSCCDCGLTHTEKYAVLEGRILRMCCVEQKVTKTRRRAKDIKDSIRMIYRKVFRKK